MHPVPPWNWQRGVEVLPITLLQLAQWIFGPTGFPNLRLLVYGDFSHQGQYRDWTFALCKNELSTVRHEDIDRFSFRAATPSDLTFRMVTGQDTALLKLFRDNQDMLGACPADNLMGPKGDRS